MESKTVIAEAVTKECVYCGNEFSVDTLRRCWWSQKFCDESCRRSHQNKIRSQRHRDGTRSDRVVKPKLTDDQRHRNEILRRKRSADSRRGQVVTQERRDKIRSTLKRRYAAGEIIPVVSGRTPEWRASVSKGMLKAYKEGRADATAHYKGKHCVYDGPNGRINMRSQSEVLFAQKLDIHGLSWQYEPSRFDLGWTTYCPDFFLPDISAYVEVKGWLTDEAAKKMDAFRAKGNWLIMTTYQEVREAGLPSEIQEVSLHGV